MASRGTHSAVGGIAGLGIYGYYKWQKKEDWTLLGIVGSIFLGMILGQLPDILEPSINNPNHRQFCHSILLLIILILAYNKVGKNGVEKLIINIATGGYISHLAVDALSPRGLPAAWEVPDAKV